MGYVTPEQIESAKEMDLLTYLQLYEPSELVRISANTYCTREHDSLKISNGKWCWHSRGIGGRNALKYLIEVKGFSFTEAVEMITGRAAYTPSVSHSSLVEPSKPKTLLLPKVNRSATVSYNYLRSRGIDDELIRFCIKTGRFYESYPHHSAVFVGLDAEGKPRYATIRGIDNDFIGEASGSDKRYSFSFPAKESDTLCLFESAIDLLSFATLLKLYGKRWNTDHLVSLAGVYKPKQELQESSLPLALKQYLADHPNIRNVHLCLDNDMGGHLAADTLKYLLLDRYGIAVVERFPPQGKDYNDYLCDKLGLQRTLRQRKEKISDERI